MKTLFLFSLLVFGMVLTGKTQSAIFLSEGKIEFVRTENVYARQDQLSNGEDDSWSEVMKQNTSKFRISYFDLLFSGNQWVYKPGKENPDNRKGWFETAEANTVVGDYVKMQAVTQKQIEGALNVITDSLRKIKWKITDENREIAGFNCRRANAIIMDSIYVVAFYTDEILIPAGPESFNGLPGMILGISLPHQHLSWFADKVEAIPVSKALLTPVLKGKKYDKPAFEALLKEAVKDWGKYGRRLLEMAEL